MLSLSKAQAKLVKEKFRMSFPKISVIIPVYNVERYVIGCITSVIDQTYKNLEIIIVDDGSTDDSGKICDELRKKDTRIAVIHQPNGGLSDARNTGLDIATGEYIAFVDGDDTIEPEMVDVLYSNLQKETADICACRYYNKWDDGRTQNIGNDHSIRVYDGMDGLREFLYGKTLDPFACGKLYKASLIGTHRFIKGRMGEDIPFNLKLFQTFPKVVLVGKSLYGYLQQRSGAICNVKISRKRIDSAFYWDVVRRECQVISQELEIFALRRQVLFYIGLYNRLYDEPEYITEKQEIRSFIKTHLKEILVSDICEKTTKVATFLLAECPAFYAIVMKLYKRLIGEAHL